MVIMDATALLLLLNEKTSPPIDPITNKPIADAHQRIEYAVNAIRKRGDKVLVAAPVLAELLVRAENAASAYIKEFNESAHFKPVPFDQVAAVLHADFTRKAIESGNKKDGVDDTLNKVKFDRQIVAIAQAEKADTIYTDDDNLALHAERRGIKVIRTHQIVMNIQTDLFDSIDGVGVDETPDLAENEEEVVEAQAVGPVLVKTEKDSAPVIENTKGETVIETVPPPLMSDSPTKASDPEHSSNIHSIVEIKEKVNTTQFIDSPSGTPGRI